jgi:hypothetical protein
LESVFEAFGIDCNSGDDISKVGELSVSERARLRWGLGAAERPYLTDFWEAGILTSAAKDYLMRNLEVFERRKQRNQATF